MRMPPFGIMIILMVAMLTKMSQASDWKLLRAPPWAGRRHGEGQEADLGDDELPLLRPRARASHAGAMKTDSSKMMKDGRRLEPTPEQTNHRQ